MGSENIDPSRVTAALEGRLDTTQLRESEETLWLDVFTEKLRRPSAAELAFHESRHGRGLGVGLDADGALVRADAASRS